MLLSSQWVPSLEILYKSTEKTGIEWVDSKLQDVRFQEKQIFNPNSVITSHNSEVIAVVPPPYNDNKKGRVRVYDFSSKTSNWEERGEPISINDSSFIGTSVVMSSNGNTIAIGTTGGIRAVNFTKEKNRTNLAMAWT